MINRFLLPLLCLATLSGSAGAKSLTTACKTALDLKAWMFAGTSGHDYYGDELSRRWMNQPWMDTLAYASRFGTVAAALKAKGIALVLAPVPPRTFVSTAFLDLSNPTEAAFDISEARRFYSSFVEALRQAGIPTADLLTGTQEADLFAKDIHWTPQGAERAAQAVAAVVRELPVYGKLPRHAFLTLDTGPATRFRPDQPVIGKVKELCDVDLAPDVYQSKVTVAHDGLMAGTGNFGSSENGKQRWAYGPSASLTFVTPKAARVTLRFKLYSPIEGQTVTVRLNGTTVDTLTNLKQGSVTDRTYLLSTVDGANRVDFAFSDWNTQVGAFAHRMPVPCLWPSTN